MTSHDDRRLPADGVWGEVIGFVRSPSGEPVEGMHIASYAVTPLLHPKPSIAAASNADGEYRLALPGGSYILKAFGPTGANVPLYGETTEVVVSVGRVTNADIVVTPQPDQR